MTDRTRFIAEMPKAELHLHIEGTLEPEMMMALAQRNGVDLPHASIDGIRKAYDFSSLQDFLDLYYQGMSVLRTRRDFHDLTAAYLDRMHDQNVRHVEIFFDPQGHTERGIAFADALEGIAGALEDAEREHGITHRLIMCFLRHLSEDSAFETLERARPHRAHIHGVGLDSSEIGNPPEKFARVFEAAIAQGYVPVAHAGEEGPPDYVRQALDALHVVRLDHGNAALDDPALTRRLAASEIALTVCPLSNLRLCVIDDMGDHPLRRMLEAGLRATVNSDDPAYFGGYMNENFEAVADALDLSHAELATLGRNAWAASLLPAHEKSEALARFDDWAARAT